MEYNILHVEDSKTDADLVNRLMKKSGLKFRYHLASDKNEVMEALNVFEPDIVLSDHSLPSFNSKMAYELCKEKNPDLPFILVTGAMSEEFAVEMLKTGVDDYLLKSNLNRLPLAIEKAFSKRESEKKAESFRLSLEQSEKEFRSLAESMPQIVWTTSPEGQNVYLNQQWVDYTGLSLEESYGDGWIRPFHPEDQQRAWETWQTAVQTKSVYKLECRLRKYDGTYQWYLIRGVPQIGNNGETVKWYGTCTDIEELKQSGRIIKKEKEFSDSIINSLPGIFCLFDENGKFLRWNKELERISGYSEQEISTMNPLQFFSDEDAPLISQKIEEVFRSGGSSAEARLITKTRNKNPIYFKGILRSYENMACLIGIDITERKLAEIQLKELHENLQKYSNELAISNAELEQFAYMASHDLQEPLRMVTSFLTLLEKKYGSVLEDKGKLYVKFAVEGAKQMRQIILDLLEFSRIGKKEEAREYLNLDELLNEIKLILRKSIQSKKATITADVLPKILANRTPLHQIFQNLLGNALKYSVENIPSHIHISVKDLKDHWQFAVADNGIGIEKEYFEKIFTIFQRLHNKEEYSGTGMGLAIAKKNIETLGGKIWVESEKGLGSTFFFTIKKQ